MTIGIIVAMQKELSLLLPLLGNHEETSIDNRIFHMGKVGSNDIVAMQCGIGKVNAAIGTMLMLTNFSVELVISTGVAGGADSSANVMDVIIGERIAYHDVWCGPGTSYGEAYGFPLYFKSSSDVMRMVDFSNNVKAGLICSGDKFISTIEEVNEIKSHYPDAIAVDMESTSIAQVCYMRNVPFFCARVISDSPGANHDNSKQYDDFWEVAPKHTFNIIHEILLKTK
jgi:adenosylhomocysteine nucleosidase